MLLVLEHGKLTGSCGWCSKGDVSQKASGCEITKQHGYKRKETREMWEEHSLADWEFRNDFSEKAMRAEKRETTSIHGEKGGALQLAGKPQDRREYSVVRAESWPRWLGWREKGKKWDVIKQEGYGPDALALRVTARKPLRVVSGQREGSWPSYAVEWRH